MTEKESDRIIPICQVKDDGTTVVARVRDDGSPEIGTVAPISGQAMVPGMEIIEFLDDGIHVKTLYKHGPAQVATKAYRDGWDVAFGKPN